QLARKVFDDSIIVRPWRKPATRWLASVSDALRRNPATGIAVCCVRTASGHAAAAPPSAASNFRRPMVTVIRPSRARCVKGTIPHQERLVFTFKGGWTAALAAQQKDERLSPLSPLASKVQPNSSRPVLRCHLINRDFAKPFFWLVDLI